MVEYADAECFSAEGCVAFWEESEADWVEGLEGCEAGLL